MPKFDKKIKSKNKEWTFNGNVHKYFDDHIKKSHEILIFNLPKKN